MADKFRQEMDRLMEGPGGHKCPCCWSYIRSRKPKAHRVARARLKAQLKKEQNAQQ